MFEEKPEISETLAWMLQSRQVGDEELVKILVHEQYLELYRLSRSLFMDSDIELAGQLAQKVICAGVEDAQEYRHGMRVQVWLFNKAIKIYRRLVGRGNKKIMGDRSSPSTAQNYWKLIDAIAEDSRLVLILKYLHGFSNQEIASILEISIPEVVARLSQVEEKWSSSKDEGKESQFLEADIKSLLSEHLPVMRIPAQEENNVTGRILNKLKKVERRKHRLVILGELVLVVIATLIVVGMGRVISEMTPEPTTQMVYQTVLVNQIVSISPTPGPTLPPTPFSDMAILYRAEGGETLADIADRIFLHVTILEALNNIPADRPLEVGQKIMIGVSDSQLLMPTPDEGFPLRSSPMPYSEPLTMNSSQEDIRQRMVESRENWLTLWADALVIQYGPSGYIGEPNFRRQQIWIDQPYFTYLLDGENGGDVEKIHTSLGGLVSLINLQTGEELTSSAPDDIHFFPDLQQMFMAHDLRTDLSGEVKILGQQSMAGRDVLVLDWFIYPDTLQGGGGEREQTRVHQGRYWIDATYGLILRQQKFNGNDLTRLLEEIIVTKMDFNVLIPRRLFDRSRPSQTYFAQGHQGDNTFQPAPVPDHMSSPHPESEPITYQPPPIDFAANESHLTFLWTNLAAFDPQQGTKIDLFGDGYYLGNIEFSAPNEVFCTRSPDGNLIAYSGLPDEKSYRPTPLRWIDLTDLPQVNQSVPGIVPYDFVFSPDNQRLAVYGCNREGEQKCGIYLVDSASGETSHLTSVEQGSGLIWNPDSSALAIQGSLLSKGKWRVLVFDAESGQVIFDGPFDWEGFWVSPDSPIHDWGVPYPPTRGGLEVCSKPPRGD